MQTAVGFLFTGAAVIHLVAFFLLWGLFAFTKSGDLVAVAAVAYIFLYGIASICFIAGMHHQRDKDKKIK